MTRLTTATLPSPLPYDRAAVTPGIVHLGIGAFHRAHMAVYVDDLLPRDPRWGIVGASLRRPDTKDALAPQDFLYTVAIREAAGTTHRIVGSILDILDANTQRAELIAMLADPRIRIVSLTVTEKGYCHDPATGKLDPNHPDIIHDLAHPDAPVSAPGLIVRAIELRRAAGIAPFSVMSCDNLPANGRTAKRIIAGLAALHSPDLAAYVEQAIAFPSTMVDRIVPATTDADRESVHAATGYDDAWPIMTEPFTQWVIEDHFPDGRPPFERAGAQLVKDVEPFERRIALTAGQDAVDAAAHQRLDGLLGIARHVEGAMARDFHRPRGVHQLGHPVLVDPSIDREAADDDTGDTQLAIREGIAKTGRPITNAALIMIVVFIAFGVTGPIPPTELGVTLALAVAIAYFLSAALIFPRSEKGWATLDEHFWARKRYVLTGILFASFLQVGILMTRFLPRLDDFWFFFWQAAYYAPIAVLWFSRSRRAKDKTSFFLRSARFHSWWRCTIWPAGSCARCTPDP